MSILLVCLSKSEWLYFFSPISTHRFSICSMPKSECPMVYQALSCCRKYFWDFWIPYYGSFLDTDLYENILDCCGFLDPLLWILMTVNIYLFEVLKRKYFLIQIIFTDICVSRTFQNGGITRNKKKQGLGIGPGSATDATFIKKD